MRVSALLALLIPLVGVVALSAPDCGPTRCATIALATIATDANSEYRPALRVATYLQPKDTVAINGRIRHPGIMPSPVPAAHDDRTDDFPPSAQMMLLVLGLTFRKLRFQMTANIR